MKLNLSNYKNIETSLGHNRSFRMGIAKHARSAATAHSETRQILKSGTPATMRMYAAASNNLEKARQCRQAIENIYGDIYQTMGLIPKSANTDLNALDVIQKKLNDPVAKSLYHGTVYSAQALTVLYEKI